MYVHSKNLIFRSLSDSEDYDDDGDGIPDTEDEVRTRHSNFCLEKKNMT